MEMKKPVRGRHVPRWRGHGPPARRSSKSQSTGKTAWTLTEDLPEPGAAIFFVEPQPYWEPAEGKYIVHYAKVVVDSCASGEGWDALVGLPVEIEPLTRPTGLWTGNLFTGVVLKHGAARALRRDRGRVRQ